MFIRVWETRQPTHLWILVHCELQDQAQILANAHEGRQRFRVVESDWPISMSLWLTTAHMKFQAFSVIVTQCLLHQSVICSSPSETYPPKRCATDSEGHAAPARAFCDRRRLRVV